MDVPMELVKWLNDNWLIVFLGLMLADKIVAITPTKYDDLILTSIKGMLKKFKGGKK